MSKFFPLLLALTAFSLLPSQSFAQAHSASFSVKDTLGDGSGGRVWKQWRQGIPNKPVQSVRVRVRKKSGGDDTFLNLRYGDGGAFENGKQVFLRDNQSKTVSWNVGGSTPNGKELVLNAYKGEVYVDNVSVYFVGHTLQKEEGAQRPKPRPRPGYAAGAGRSPSDNRDDWRADDDDDERVDSDDPTAVRNCRRIRRQLRRPEIDIYNSRQTGGLFSGKYKIEGEIYGACIEEAGYYESGELREEIKFPLSDRYNRERFKFKVNTGRRGQIRVLTFDGRREVVDIDALVLKNKQGSQQQGQGQFPIPLPF